MSPERGLPAIAGAYQDRGRMKVVGGARSGSTSLQRLLEPAGAARDGVDVVVIRGPRDGRLDFQFMQRGVSVGTVHQPLIQEPSARHRIDGTPCHEGLIPYRVESRVNALAPLPVGIYSGDEIWLGKALDGSLIVLRRRSSGAWVILPWWSMESSWHCFSPVAGGRAKR